MVFIVEKLIEIVLIIVAIVYAMLYILPAVLWLSSIARYNRMKR